MILGSILAVPGENLCVFFLRFGPRSKGPTNSVCLYHTPCVIVYICAVPEIVRDESDVWGGGASGTQFFVMNNLPGLAPAFAPQFYQWLFQWSVRAPAVLGFRGLGSRVLV
jgi:hypothetical protein